MSGELGVLTHFALSPASGTLNLLRDCLAISSGVSYAAGSYFVGVLPR
nr:MAG TPA: hypothetical protein [Caudoviricetes sp.]